MTPRIARLAALLAALWLLSPAPAGAVGTTLSKAFKDALDKIDDDDVKLHEEFLTSDQCAGRDTPAPGLETAAEYIIEQHKKLGLEGAGKDGSFRQLFEVPAVYFSKEDYLGVEKNGDLRVFAPGEDFVPVRGCPSGEAEGEVVFAGYGIFDSDERYDDFKGVSVKNKIVVVLSHEPRQNRKGRAFKGLDFTSHARLERKALAAHQRGAVAVIVLSNPLHHEDLSVLKSEHPRHPSAFRGIKESPIPVVHGSGKVAEALMGLDQLREWQKYIDGKLRGSPKLLEGIQVRLKVSMQRGDYPVANVVAMRRGTDPELHDEWIVVGAHYDHVGVDSFGQIFRGADDNASGTSCLLEVAKALSSPDIELRRSVFNMDMVGRGRPNDIDAVGVQYSRDLKGLLKKAVSETRTRLRLGNEGMEFWERSDQYAFWESGVPSLFFMEAELHPDYHQITDTPDKIDNKKVAKVARVVAGLTYLVSVQDKAVRGETGEKRKN
jgi:hypothetical protein